MVARVATGGLFVKRKVAINQRRGRERAVAGAGGGAPAHINMTDDLDRELRAHLENEADDQRARGLSDQDAHRRAAGARQRGDHPRGRSGALAVGGAHDAAQDIRYGLRLLKKHPGFAVVAALTLALGVGATTTIFSVVHAVLLRPLPYADADRLAMVWENVNLPQYKNAQNAPAPGNFRDWRDQNSTLLDLAAMRDGAWSLTGNGDPVRVGGEMVSASLFRLLQIEPALGRMFSADEDRARRHAWSCWDTDCGPIASDRTRRSSAGRFTSTRSHIPSSASCRAASSFPTPTISCGCRSACRRINWRTTAATSCA